MTFYHLNIKLKIRHVSDLKGYFFQKNLFLENIKRGGTESSPFLNQLV